MREGKRNDRRLMLAKTEADINRTDILGRVIFPHTDIGVGQFFTGGEPLAALGFRDRCDGVMMAANERLIVRVGGVGDDDGAAVWEGEEVLAF